MACGPERLENIRVAPRGVWSVPEEGGLFQETHGHLLQCPPLVKNVQYLKGQTSKLEEKSIYGNIEQQHMIVNIYSDIFEERENLQQRKNYVLVT